MVTLYLLLLLMLISTGIFLFLFRVKHPLFIFIFISLFSSALYFLFSNQSALSSWLTEGKQHYYLLTQVEELGGIDGMIKRVNKKLEINPNDSEGWIILGKLYLAKGDKVKAEKASKHRF